MSKSKLLATLLAAGFAGAVFAAPPAFDDVDHDGDGVISREEASKVEGLEFAAADVNQDGRLDRAEYEVAATKM